MFLGAKIGTYRERDVLKKGDTIVVEAINKKYLLSRQAPLDNKTAYGDYHAVNGINNGIITKDGWYLGKDLNDNSNVIGYITTTSRKSNSTASGEMARFAQNAVGCEFIELTCDTSIENKFNQFCEWQICKMTNTANVFQLSYSDYEKMIEEDTALNNKIIMLNLQDIITSVSNSIMSDLTKGVFDMNTSLRDVTVKSVVNFATENKLTGKAGACVNTALNAFEKVFNQQYKDLTTITANDMIENQKIRDMYKAEFQKSVEDAYHTFFDLLDDCNPNISKRIIVYKIFPEIVNAGMMLAANTTIKYSVAPEYKKSLNAHIEKAKKKIQIVEQCKQEYEQKFKRTNGDCLEYTKTINALKAGLFEQQYGSDELDEINKLIQDYVFLGKEIPKCNILSVVELRPAVKNTQPQKTADTDCDIIGYYGNIPVCKNNNSIILNDDVYNLLFQPKQNSFDNKLIRYFLIYEGSNGNLKFEDKGKLIGYNKKNFIGWINYDVLKNTYKFEQYTNDQSIPGLNFFGSVYIGDNNPTSANGKPNYDVPAQDEIDNGAKLHDICYDNLGLKGKDGVFGSEGLHCDHDFAALCLKNLNLKNMAAFASSSLPKHASIIAGLIDYYKGDRHLTLNMLSNAVFKPRSTRDRAILVIELFSATSAKKAYENTAEEVFEKILIKDSTYKVTFRKNSVLNSATNEKEQFEVQAGDIFEGEMKNGKVVHGKVIRNNETVKIFLNQRNH